MPPHDRDGMMGLRETLERIGEITGRNYHENLLDTIFGNFCVGK